MTRYGRWLLAAVLVLGLGRVAPAATWTLIANSDCTGMAAATGVASTAVVNCCTGLRSGYCDKRGTAMGTEFARIVYAVAAGNYTPTTGDAIAAAQMNKLGMREQVYATCNPTASVTAAQNGLGVVLTRTTATPTVRLFNGGTELTAVSIANTVINCLVIGH